MHPFAQYIRTLGRGKKGSRDLTQEEAYDAFKMILNNEVEAEQLGAFLMLVRVKEETPAELAGFVQAAREAIPTVEPSINIDLDWSSYAGKRRQLPWFLLSALLLAHNNTKILMHGLRGRKDNRVYTPDILSLFDLSSADSLTTAIADIQQYNFAFIELDHLVPKLAELIELREILGLRSPVHSLSRLLNPLNAPNVIQGIFHPGYKAIHRDAAILLNTPQATIIKGDGGEIEMNPDVDNETFTVAQGEHTAEVWPAMFGGKRHLKDETMNSERLLKVWRGDIEDEYGEAAVVLTAAVALKLIGKASNQADALALAKQCWQNRPKDKY